jgi:hypothetical protein
MFLQPASDFRQPSAIATRIESPAARVGRLGRMDARQLARSRMAPPSRRDRKKGGFFDNAGSS